MLDTIAFTNVIVALSAQSSRTCFTCAFILASLNSHKYHIFFLRVLILLGISAWILNPLCSICFVYILRFQVVVPMVQCSIAFNKNSNTTNIQFNPIELWCTHSKPCELLSLSLTLCLSKYTFLHAWFSVRAFDWCVCVCSVWTEEMHCRIARGRCFPHFVAKPPVILLYKYFARFCDFPSFYIYDSSERMICKQAVVLYKMCVCLCSVCVLYLPVSNIL